MEYRSKIEKDLRIKNMMLILGLNETMDQLTMTVIAEIVMCRGERMVMFSEGH